MAKSSKQKPKRGAGKCKYTLVAADGKYYLVSENGKPVLVKNPEKVAKLIGDFEDLLTDLIQTRMAAGSGVHLQTPEIFPK